MERSIWLRCIPCLLTVISLVVAAGTALGDARHQRESAVLRIATPHGEEEIVNLTLRRGMVGRYEYRPFGGRFEIAVEGIDLGDESVEIQITSLGQRGQSQEPARLCVRRGHEAYLSTPGGVFGIEVVSIGRSVGTEGCTLACGSLRATGAAVQMSCGSCQR